MAHTKSEGKRKEKGRLKGQVVVNCHTRDPKECSTAAEFLSIIEGVSVDGNHYRMEPAVGPLDIIYVVHLHPITQRMAIAGIWIECTPTY